MSNLLSFGDYQQWVINTGFYPGKREVFSAPNMESVSYCTLGLVGEAGEVADKVKKILRDHDGALTPELKDGLIKEMGDTLWYLTALANELDVTVEVVAQANVDKIEGRNARGTRRGSGDDR